MSCRSSLHQSSVCQPLAHRLWPNLLQSLGLGMGQVLLPQTPSQAGFYSWVCIHLTLSLREIDMMPYTSINRTSASVRHVSKVSGECLKGACHQPRCLETSLSRLSCIFLQLSQVVPLCHGRRPRIWTQVLPGTGLSERNWLLDAGGFNVFFFHGQHWSTIVG